MYAARNFKDVLRQCDTHGIDHRCARQDAGWAANDRGRGREHRAFVERAICGEQAWRGYIALLGRMMCVGNQAALLMPGLAESGWRGQSR